MMSLKIFLENLWLNQTIDTTLSSDNPLRFRCSLSEELQELILTLADKIKTYDNKIKANEAHYDLDREAANISALPSGKLNKYKYLTGQDLGYKPG